MNKLKVAKLLAWAAMLIVVACIVLVFFMDFRWWSFVDLFFAFLMVFCHLLAVYMNRTSAISRQLDLTALVCGILMMICVIVDYFLL